MSVLLIIVIVLAVLAIGGVIARFMWLRRTETQFRARLERADNDLAEAAAQDRGWDRPRLEQAARGAYLENRGREPDELHLAVFRAEAEGARHMLTLGRRGDEWVLERIE